MCLGILAGMIKGNLTAVTGAILGSTRIAVETLISLAGAICFWTGLMNIAEESGLSSALSALTRPLVRPLFPHLSRSSPAYQFIALNLAANLLGLGNAATPLGLQAMDAMAKDEGTEEASDDMCTLAVFNTAGPSLVPGSILALRASLGSARPDAIVGPAFMAGICAAAAALVSDRIFKYMRGRRR
jgi:spore maturation protein A